MLTPPFPNKKYQVLLCDPPWAYENWNNKWHAANSDVSRWVGNKYPLMSAKDIAALPVKDITAESSILFMWTISTMIPDALKVIEAWGFTYRTVAFVWVKKNKKADSFFTGMGFWTRSNAEICLLAKRGPTLKRVSKSVRQIVYSPVRGHSQKPPEVRERIVELMGDLPRIELFARDKVEGWDSWGNEIET